MSHDLDVLLKGWPFKPDVVQARLVPAQGGRQVIHMRVDLGVLQLELTGRPDGTRPHGFPTYFDYLKSVARSAQKRGESFALDEENCSEADREFMQFYHRRVCWLALRNFAKAVADADHTLAFMDFIKEHSPGDEYTAAHERYRPFVLFHRTQADAALASEGDRPEAAIEAIRTGLEQIRRFYGDHDAEEQMDDDGMVQTLRTMEQSLRQLHGIDATLQEKLQAAIDAEDYETAARLRDQMRKRG